MPTCLHFACQTKRFWNWIYYPTVNPMSSNTLRTLRILDFTNWRLNNRKHWIITHLSFTTYMCVMCVCGEFSFKFRCHLEYILVSIHRAIRVCVEYDTTCTLVCQLWNDNAILLLEIVVACWMPHMRRETVKFIEAVNSKVLTWE